MWINTANRFDISQSKRVQSKSLCNVWFVYAFPYSKVHGTNKGPTWVLSAPDGPHVDPMNLAFRAIGKIHQAVPRGLCKQCTVQFWYQYTESSWYQCPYLWWYSQSAVWYILKWRFRKYQRWLLSEISVLTIPITGMDLLACFTC